ncbi:Eukaryotic translation initiation factor 2C [Tulasnella sp. 408]|nr:Eukaryotic translation initiation factor 2C [Tulasnella sp. 408]
MPEGQGPSPRRVRINSTARYVEGKMTYDEKISTTLNACNVAIRMQPIQSVRPVIGKMVVNVDISSAAFYKPGPLIKLCLDYLEASPEANPVQFLSANRLNARTRVALSKFLRTLHVKTTTAAGTRVRSIRSISEEGANTLPFELNGTTISVAVSVV